MAAVPQAFGVSDPGSVRERNEDAFLVERLAGGWLLIVCDGMGGHLAGERASALAVQTLRAALMDSLPSLERVGPIQLLQAAFEAAHHEVIRESQAVPEFTGMGTTAVAALILDRVAYVAHVGDSRLFLMREGSLVQITDDHTVVREMVRHGILSMEQTRSHPEAGRLSCAVGMEKAFRVEVRAEGIPLTPGDVLLLCTDGLTDVVADRDIELALLHPASTAARRLIALARDHGAPDNVTAVVWQLGSPRSWRARLRSSRWLCMIRVLLLVLLGAVLGTGLWLVPRFGESGAPRSRPTVRRGIAETDAESPSAPQERPDISNPAAAMDDQDVTAGLEDLPPPSECQPAAFTLVRDPDARNLLVQVYHALEDGREAIGASDANMAREHLRDARRGLDRLSARVGGDPSGLSLEELCELEWTSLRADLLDLHYREILRAGARCETIRERASEIHDGLGVLPQEVPQDVMRVIDSCGLRTGGGS